MPLWFKCTGCKKKYYTADTSRKNKENTCEECGAELEIVEKEEIPEAEMSRDFSQKEAGE